jgi:hypothetical protein
LPGLGNETATSNFGHSSARVPEWLHIGAYPHAFANCRRLGLRYETPATEHIRCRSGLEVGLIAMQKVVGSNPISRFFANPLHVGGSGSARVAETRSNHPLIGGRIGRADGGTPSRHRAAPSKPALTIIGNLHGDLMILGKLVEGQNVEKIALVSIFSVVPTHVRRREPLKRRLGLLEFTLIKSAAIVVNAIRSGRCPT